VSSWIVIGLFIDGLSRLVNVVDCDVLDVLFLIFIWMLVCAFDNHKSLIYINGCCTFFQTHLRRNQKYLREEVLFSQACVVVRQLIFFRRLARLMTVHL
jgi:hypothetical protein